MINSFKAANIDVGSLSVSITPATGVTGTLTTGEANSGTVTIPAGALYVKIENAGMVASGDTPGNITVNGQPFTPGRIEIFNAIIDPQNNEFIFLPEIEITTSGARVRYAYFG